ncbi:DUF29 family protein [Spirulina sp. 06S082]|uniref:DUF29 family protein n=1 Tax=Spirulina sp. 06S082 TaxID=3110248 RepID=UPI002B1EDA41|nr:DUF29 family protein [Spirulina sp. 06S082]MEA5468097.1 DUF29 family protein [Spirulina sp. 06S082]
MTQELVDLRTAILEGRYDEALVIVDDLEFMSRKSIVLNLESYLTRILIHLIKNQVEQRLTNSWAVSIRESTIQIKKINLRDNRKSYYLKYEEWNELLDDVFDTAIDRASLEISEGISDPEQLSEMVSQPLIFTAAKSLILLTYNQENIKDAINQELGKLPGGEKWKN